MRICSGNADVWNELVWEAYYAMLFMPSSEPTVFGEIRAVHCLLLFLSRTKGRSNHEPP
jgi:hypothetical protein